MKNSVKAVNAVNLFFLPSLFLFCSSVFAVDIGVEISSPSNNSDFTPGDTQTNTYEITVSKTNGSDDVTGITINSTFGNSDEVATLSWSCSASGSSVCGSSSGGPQTGESFTNTLDLIGNDDVVITVTSVMFNSDLFSDITFSTSITDFGQSGGSANADGNGNAANNTDSINLNRDSVTNLSVNLTDNRSFYIPGSSASYTMTVTNAGPSDADNVDITDILPAGLTITGWTCSANAGSSCSSASGSGLINDGNLSVDLEDGDSATITLNGLYDSGITTEPLTYQATATISDSNATDPGGATNSDSNNLPNVTVVVTDGDDDYVPGLGSTFTVTVTNQESTEITGLPVIDNALSEFATISWTCSADMNSSCPAGPVTNAIDTTINLGANDGEVVFTVVVTYDSAAKSDPLVYEVSSIDNTGQDSNDLDRQVNISLTKAASKTGSLVPNESYSYSLIVTNLGPSDLGAPDSGFGAENILTLSDDIDIKLLNHPTVCGESNGEPCWQYCLSDEGVPNTNISPMNCPGTKQVGNGYDLDVDMHLSAGSSSEVIIYARVPGSITNFDNCDTSNGDGKDVCNIASAVLDDPSGTTTDNSIQSPLEATVSNALILGTDLIVTKTDGLVSAAPGEEISYEIIVRNDGFINANGITVSDLLPIYPNNTAGFITDSVSWICETNDVNACCVSQSALSCGFNDPVQGDTGDTLTALIDLDGQSEVKFTITATIAELASGTIVNNVTASLPNGISEANPNDNTATDDDTVLQQKTDLSVTKSLISSEINENDSSVIDLEYEIIVTNLGPSAATDSNVIDALSDNNIDVSTAEWTCEIIGNGVCDDAGPVSGSGIDATVDLSVGSSAAFNLKLSTKPNSEGSVLNVVNANVSPEGFDPVSINNIASVEFALSGISQITIDNDDALNTATPGTSTNYTVRIQNEGPDNIFGATVENLFPSELTGVEWTCNAISPIPGDLTFFQSSDQSANGNVMLLSPDDSHVYIASPDPDGSAPYESRIYVFERHTLPGANYGQLEFIEFLTMGENNIAGIEAVQELQMSNDGAYLYALSNETGSDDAITTFNRNNNRLSPSFGQLTFLNAISSDMPASSIDMVISPDQKHIYISGDDELSRFSRDVGTGLLTFDETLAATIEGHMTFSQDGSNLYVADQETSGQIDAYSRESDNGNANFGDLTKIGDVAHVDINQVSDLIISADDKNLYLATSGADKIVVINRDISDGSISFSASYDDDDLSFNITETLVGLDQLNISPDGQHLFVSNPVDGSLLVLSRNSQGLLSKDQRIFEPGTQGLIDVVVTADAKQVLTTSVENDGKTLMAFDRRQPDPTFSFVEVEIDGVDSMDQSTSVVDGLFGASAVEVSHDGDFVYVAGIGDDSVSVFIRDKTKGSTIATRGEHLLYLASYRNGESGITGIDGVNSLAVTPNGEFLFAGSRDNGTLAVFNRLADGSLDFVVSYSHSNNTIDGLLGISDLLVDSNSQSLYVAGQFEASVAHYSISGTGHLSLQGAVSNGEAGVSGLAGARALALTNDGNHILVAGGIDDSVVVLKRSTEIESLGNIEFQQSLLSIGDQPMDVAISPDGEHVYLASANDSKLSVLRRVVNQSSNDFGQLSLVASYIDGVDGFNELSGLRSVVVSPNGDKVYVGAEFDHALSVLDRDTNPNSASFGQLVVVEVQVDDVSGTNGLNQLYQLAVSGDSKHVYAVGFGDNALAAFVLGIGSSCSTQGSGNIIDKVDIGSNGTLTYNITGKIRSNAVGSLVTEARVLPPENFTFISPQDNCINPESNSNDSCDQDSTQLVPETDLSITKTNGKLSVIAGEPVEYEIRVSNSGPSDANSTESERVMVLDLLNDSFVESSISWTCQAVGSGSLSFVEAVINDDNEIQPQFQGLTGVSSLAYSADLAGFGPHVFATSVLDNALLVFSVNPLDGTLTQVLSAGSIISATSGIQLAGARDVLVIDNDIYVASQIDDAVVAFRANDSSGLEVEFQSNYQYPEVSFGLNQAVALTASDNGTHVYVAGANDDAIVVFSRDLLNGQLTYENTISVAGQGLGGINDVAVSLDGYSVYSSGLNENNLGVYKRDLINGELTFINTVIDGEVEFVGINSITISPDDNHVYTTSSENNKVYVFSRDTSVLPESNDYGQLQWVQTIEQGTNNVSGMIRPSNSTVSSDGRHVYITSEQSDAVLWFARNSETGELNFGGLISDVISSVDGLNGALDVIVDDSGTYIYVAGSQDNGIAVFTRTADSFCPSAGTGNVSEMDGSIEAGVEVDLAVNGELIFIVNATVATNATAILSNEARVLSCDLPLVEPQGAQLTECPGSDPVSENNVAEDIDVINSIADLMITKTDGISLYQGLSGANKLTGDDNFVYVAASQDNAISLFKRQSNANENNYGELAYEGQIKNGENGVSGLLAVSDIIISDDGFNVYAAGSGDNSIVVFNKNTNGELEFVEKQSSGVFGVSGIEGVTSLTLSADGAHLYATGPLTNSMAVFAVDQSGGSDHGKLSFIQSLQNAVDGVSGLANISDVVVTSDNKHVYVTSESGHSISLFLRNPNDASVSYGQLSYQESYINGNNGLAGLLGAKALISDASGSYIYVLGAIDQSVVVFSRDNSTGELTFVEFKQNGTGGVVGLNLANDLMISSDQHSLYVAGRGENALVSFDRDINNGTLLFADSITDGDDLSQPGTFVDGLSGASGLFISSDDAHLYITGSQDHAVSVYLRDNMNPIPLLGSLSFIDVLINGRGGVAPGTEVTYLIVASNSGPSNAQDVRVVDVFPPEFESISYQCFPINGAGCVTTVRSGNVDETVDLPVGSRVEILATGVIRTDAIGTISNTATVMSSTDASTAISDPDESNNTATDDDTILFVSSDLMVTKDNGTNESIPGTEVSYTITVSNDAILPGNSIPADVNGVIVTDILPESISDASWSCEATPQVGLLDDGDGDPMTDSYIAYNDLMSFEDFVIQSNGETAYAVGSDSGESSILVYQRNSRSGSLSVLQQLSSNELNYRIEGAIALAISPDMSHLYVVSNIDDSISSWSIDAVTGELDFINVFTDGLSGVNGIGGANDVIVSKDGMHVYVAGKSDNAIAIFDRNIGTGELVFNSVFTGVEGLSGVHAIEEYNGYLLVIAEANQSLASFERSAQTGLLSSVDVIQNFELPGTVLEGPRDLEVVNDRIYVVAYDSNALSEFSIDNEDGMVEFIRVTRNGEVGVNHLEGPESLLSSSSGTELYVVSSISESIMLFIHNGDTFLATDIFYDTTLIPELDGANQLVMNAQGTHLYALSDELVLTNVQNGSTCTSDGVGSLNDIANIVSGGQVEYTLTGTILPTATGTLTNIASAFMSGEGVELDPLDNVAEDVDNLIPTSDLSITKDDGLTEVVAGTAVQYDVSIFSAGPSSMLINVDDLMPIFPSQNAGFETGTTSWSCSTTNTLQDNSYYSDNGTNGLASGTMIIESPDQNFVYIISDSGTLSVYSKDSSGILSLEQFTAEGDSLPGGEVVGLLGSVAIDMDSEGENIYIVSQTNNHLTIFSRNPIDGQVDYIQTITSGVEGVIGMAGPTDVKVTPDNSAVYVAAYDSDAITVFSRDVDDGSLSFVERVKDGFGTIVPESNVIIEPVEIVISPDGQFLYTVADFSEAVAVFSRDPMTQVLTFESVIREGDQHGSEVVPAMSGPQKLLMTTNGDYVYSAIPDESAMWRFSRNQNTGELSFEKSYTDGEAGLGSLMSISNIELTPDGGRLLTTDAANNVLSLYERETVTGDITLTEEFDLNIDTPSPFTNPISLTNDGTNIYVLHRDQDRLVAIRITAAADCLSSSGMDDLPSIPLSMSPGSAAELQINGQVHPSARGVITNTAQITLSPNNDDVNLMNNIASDDTTIIIQTDVSVTKAAPDRVVAGELIEYQIYVNNSGPSDALGVVVQDSIPVEIVGVTWTCVATGRSTCSNATGTGNIDESINVTIDGDVTFEISGTVRSDTTGVLNNSVEAIVFEFGDNTDTNLSNNQDDVSTIVDQVSDFNITKSNGTNQVIAGTSTTYFIVVNNSGPSDGQARVIDLMPVELENVTWQCNAGNNSSCTASGSSNVDEVAYIAANSQITLQIDAGIDSSAVGQLVNEAIVNPVAPVTDPNLNNNITTDSDEITQEADLQVMLEDLIDPYDPAGPVDLPFNLRVINNGPSDSSNVQVNLPLQLDPTSDTINVCAVSSSGVNCDIGYSEAGEIHDFIVNYRLNPNLTGDVDNLAEATSDTFDPNLNNNIAETTTTLVNGVDVRVSQSTEVVNIGPAEQIVYEITVENIGSVDAGLVSINEQLPIELINASWVCEAFESATCDNINESMLTAEVDLPSGGWVVMTLTATVDPLLQDVGQMSIVNTVEAVIDQSVNDFNLLNNVSNEMTELSFYIFKNGFEEVQP